MTKVVFGVVLLLVLVGAGLAPLPATTADVFCDNLKQVAATLPKNTSSSPAHFATTTFGHPPDAVYALALCRGDVVNDSACGECVASALSAMLNVTPPPPQQCYRDFKFYVGPCVIIYSVHDILASSNTTGGNGDDDPPYTFWSAGNWGSWGNWSINNITGDAHDVSLTVGLLQELLVRTAQAAASPTAPRRFATGVMDSGTTLPLFYSMAQCTPDMSAGDCSACLNRLLGMVNSTIALRAGGQIYVIRCYLRYEDFVFYGSKPMLQVGPTSAAAAPAPTPTMDVKHKSSHGCNFCLQHPSDHQSITHNVLKKHTYR